MELKNDLAITGTLHSVDQYLNIKLNAIRVVDPARYPHMVRGWAGLAAGWACGGQQAAARLGWRCMATGGD